MKITPKRIIDNRKIHRPNAVAYSFFRMVAIILSAVRGAKFYYGFEKKEMRGKQVFLLSDHASRDEFIYTIAGYPFARLNPVIGNHHVYFPIILPFVLMLGFIPKKNFNPEIRPIKEMLKIFSCGGSVLMFPEGVQSFSGHDLPILYQTAALLKKSGMTVVLCKSFGAFLANPDFGNKRRKGRMEFHYDILFTPDDLKSLSEKEIFRNLTEKFRYNDPEWNEERKYIYRSRYGLANGIENMLYLCPQCGSEGTISSEKNRIFCSRCNAAYSVDNTYKISSENKDNPLPFSRIDQWYEYQRQCICNEINSPDFSFSYECYLYRVNNDRFTMKKYRNSGEGILTIDRKYIHYVGTDGSLNIDVSVDVKQIHVFYLANGINGNDLYYNGEFFCFKPKNKSVSISKINILVQELHKKAIENQL